MGVKDQDWLGLFQEFPQIVEQILSKLTNQISHEVAFMW